MNKKQTDLLHTHNTRNEGTIFNAYARPSNIKISIWHDIEEEATKLENATRPKVNTFNAQMFTASFTYEQDGVRRLRYYLPSRTHDFEIE